MLLDLIAPLLIGVAVAIAAAVVIRLIGKEKRTRGTTSQETDLPE